MLFMIQKFVIIEFNFYEFELIFVFSKISFRAWLRRKIWLYGKICWLRERVIL